MNYLNVLCVGDSQTYGARTYGCYPLYLAQILSEQTPYAWRAISRSQNGDRARELWFRVNEILDGIHDTHQACVMIGTNDVANDVDLGLFEEYLRQVVRAFSVKKYKAVYVAEIPPLFPDGHVFFPKHTAQRRDAYNAAIRRVVAEAPQARMVVLSALARDSYEDPVHFNEKGNRLVAEAFAKEILAL
jgi:lysophospholipase L1-like esterase